jgi:hypothetical protein
MLKSPLGAPAAPSVRSTSYLARHSLTPRASEVPAAPLARPVAKSLPPPAVKMPSTTAPQRPEVQRLLSRAKPRVEQQRAPAHSGVHRVSEVQGAPREPKKDSSLVELSRVLESAPPPPARASRNLPPAPPKSTWAPKVEAVQAKAEAVQAKPVAVQAKAKAVQPTSQAAQPKNDAAFDKAAEAVAASAFREEKTMRGPAVAPAVLAQPTKPAAQVITKSGKAPLRLPPLPPRGQASNKPRPNLPPLPTRAGNKAQTKGSMRPSQRPLVVPPPPPARERGARTVAQSVWSAVASFTNRGGGHR